jgi:acyl-CoA reductase-like NAD-dependent aldehyde dehydrogenase
LKKYITKFFGEDPQKSESYARIISKDHTKRLADLFAQGKVEFGGIANIEDRYVAPTIITNPKLDGALMVRLSVFETLINANANQPPL